MSQSSHQTESSETTTHTEDTLPSNTESVENTLVSQSEQLLANVQSLCNIPGFQPITLAFPEVINGQSFDSSNAFDQNVQQLFSQQAQLFNPELTSPEPLQNAEASTEATNSASSEEIPESEELQAIRNMFDAN